MEVSGQLHALVAVLPVTVSGTFDRRLHGIQGLTACLWRREKPLILAKNQIMTHCVTPLIMRMGHCPQFAYLR
jgi:hypothetical protein